MKTIKTLFATLLAVCAGNFALASGDGVHINTSTHDPRDAASLQRGAQLFVNYCQGCHTAQYMRYNRLTDIGLTEKQIIDNLMINAADKKIGDTMTNNMSVANAKAWFGAVPPDLSVIARSYGTDRLYSYLKGFYRDDSRPTGWNNIVSPNIGMPHVLAPLQGTPVLKQQSFEDHAAAGAAKVMNTGISKMEDVKGKTVISSIDAGAPGSMNAQQYDQAVADIVNFLEFVAEPYKRDRVAIGIWMFIFLALLAFLAHALYKNYWKDVH